MIREIGFCSGVENYSRIFDGRPVGSAPHTLMDYFPDDFLVVIDESHQTIPQLNAMYAGDKRRKETLIEFGFRLPSAADNRPLRFQEFQERASQTILVSATPGPWEREHSSKIVEQIIRPTGLIDPEIQIRPIKGQIDDLISEIHQARRARRADYRHDPHQEDGRRPDRVPGRNRDESPVPPQRRPHAGALRNSPGSSVGNLRRHRRDQPAPRGNRPA